MRPTIGRIVHYVLGPSDGVHEYRVGESRAAMIVQVWGGECVNLQVFLDGSNDAYEKVRHPPDHPGGEKEIPRFMLWGLSRNFSEGGEPGTWHWPPMQPIAVPMPAPSHAPAFDDNQKHRDAHIAALATEAQAEPQSATVQAPTASAGADRETERMTEEGAPEHTGDPA